MLSETELTAYIEQHRSEGPSSFSRDFWRTQAEAAQQQRRQVQTTERAEARELRQLRQRVATLERMVLGKDGVLIKAVGRELGRNRRELDDQIRAIEERAPTPIPLPLIDQHEHPTMRYAGLWSGEKSYRAGDLATYNGSGWIAQIHTTGLRPGDGLAWKLAIKGDPSHLKAIVKAEVTRQLKERR